MNTEKTKSSPSSPKAADATAKTAPASWKVAFAILGDIRGLALDLKKGHFPEQTPEKLIFLFAQSKRLREVLRALERSSSGGAGPQEEVGDRSAQQPLSKATGGASSPSA